MLCLDTCIVLDILRDPCRPGRKAKEHAAASLALLGIAEAGSALEVRVADQVRHEYADRVDEVQEQATRAIAKLGERIREIDELAALHGGVGQVATQHWDGHPERCRQAAERWMKVAKPTPPPWDVERTAFARVNKGLRPARRGSDNMKDCVIFETYMAYVKDLRKDSSRTVVFVSSNTRDFANERGNDVANEIRDELLAVDLQYAPNMGTARRLLGLLPSGAQRASQ